MYFDDIIKQAEEPIQKKVFADKDEEMFVSIFKAEEDTGENLENPDEGGNDAPAAGGQAAGGNQGGNDTGEDLENPDQGGAEENQGGNQGGNQDDNNGEELENPDEGGNQGGNQGGEENQGGENLENPDQGGQDPNAQQDPNSQPPQDPNAQQQEGGESETDKKIKDINERILLFRKHRKLEDTVQILSDSVASAIGQVVTSDNRLKLIKIQKDLLVTKGQIEYAISLDFKTIDMEKATEIYKVMEKKVALMSDTLKKIRKENAEA